VLWLAPSDTGGHASQAATPPPPTWWTIEELAAKQTWLGVVEATDEREVVEKAAAEFKQYAPKLMAVPRS
jgi:hypothetical protein